MFTRCMLAAIRGPHVTLFCNPSLSSYQNPNAQHFFHAPHRLLHHHEYISFDTILLPTRQSLAMRPINLTLGTDHLLCVAGRWSPEEEAGLWSRLFFSFCTGLIKMGKQKVLNPEDLWDLPHSDEAAAVSQVCAVAIICCMSCLPL